MRAHPTHNRILRRAAAAITLITALAIAAPARAQLTPTQVLVVYDSRIVDSLGVAEYYAGSAKVPGGAGNLPGIHPTVNVVNLATLSGGGVVPSVPDISYADFKSKLRDPLRAYFTSTGLTRRIRCIVLTKGLPHRVQDIANPTVGDNPGLAGNQFVAGNATYAAVDSELCLLWQNLDTGEAGGLADSKADGMIVNPYARKALPIGAWSTANIGVSPKTYIPGAGEYLGLVWRNGVLPAAANLLPGDFYMVCRLDGNTQTDIRNQINRAQNLIVNVNTGAFILNKDPQDFDNDGPPYTNAGADYENARDALVNDARFNPANVHYLNAAGSANFIVGPLINYGDGTIVSDPILLLATYGSNHNGVPAGAGTNYVSSFNYPSGAVFNSIESYNGRDFNGLGQDVFAPQQQSAAAIAAGVTFALANVWEPTDWAVPDNVFIVNNFFLGNLTWAEAAYTSLPALSWQEIVLGDPLARVTRSSEDINHDGKLTIDDLYAWYATPTDLNRNSIANDTDYRLLEASVRGFEMTGMKGDQR